MRHRKASIRPYNQFISESRHQGRTLWGMALPRQGKGASIQAPNVCVEGKICWGGGFVGRGGANTQGHFFWGGGRVEMVCDLLGRLFLIRLDLGPRPQGAKGAQPINRP